MSKGGTNPDFSRASIEKLSSKVSKILSDAILKDEEQNTDNSGGWFGMLNESVASVKMSGSFSCSIMIGPDLDRPEDSNPEIHEALTCHFNEHSNNRYPTCYISMGINTWDTFTHYSTFWIKQLQLFVCDGLNRRLEENFRSGSIYANKSSTDITVSFYKSK